MQRRSSRAILMSCVLGGWLGLGAPIVAQRASQPSVSVVTFQGDGAPREARDAMADELAARLVDTGHFRVLHREWLPHESDAVPALDALRAAAQSANVDYLVLGTIRQSTRVPPPQSSVMAFRSVGPVLARPVLLPIASASRPARQQTTVVVDVRVVNVTTADIVRTATAQRAYFSTAGPRAPFLVPAGSPVTTLVATLATVAARSRTSSSTRLNKDWRKVVQEVAAQLDARGVPAPPRR
ncbi:MAG TPA: CsgG/HfaB family protein [Vicinamibacterales bacterium]|nr:CsgG/HfaB family protein [Vicinamibacterales bacterium]